MSYGSAFNDIDKSWVAESKDNFISKVLKAFLGESYVADKSIKHYGQIEKYIIKKLIQIARTYPKYKDFFSDNKQQFDIPKQGSTISDKIELPPHSFYRTEEYLELLVKDNSHITFKLRQAINYLKVNPFKSYEKEKVELPQEVINVYKLPISDFSDAIMPFAKTQQNVIRFIPPSLFDIELELNQINSEKSPSYYSMLSSGEQQLIQSVQSILYHINNLESVHDDKSNADDNKKEYKFVNIILDEIELYFHPDFQRKFISHLIKRIAELGTDRVKTFNILFATHSPFILSDIPSSNILRLREGKPDKLQEERQTFGANIHDLLANDFFLDKGFMGEFAKETINEAIHFLTFHINKREIEKVEQREKELEKEGNVIPKYILARKEALEAENEYVRDELNVNTDIYQKEHHQSIIKLIGEDIMRIKLDEMYTLAFEDSDD